MIKRNLKKSRTVNIVSVLTPSTQRGRAGEGGECSEFINSSGFLPPSLNPSPTRERGLKP
jgi:hypothetical protein